MVKTVFLQKASFYYMQILTYVKLQNIHLRLAHVYADIERLCAYHAFPFRQYGYSASMYNSQFCEYFN